MGCVYSNQNGSSKKKPNTGANGDLANGNGPNSGDPVRWNSTVTGSNGSASSNNNHSNANQSATRCRIFDVEVCNVDKEGTIQGKLEITDNSLIYRLKSRSPIIWPLRFLRSYGHDKDIFSFECGRRCPTGEGVYVFKCSNAEQLFKTLLEVVNNVTHINSSNIAINNPLSGTVPHSIAGSSNTHEYQNLSPFEGDHGNFGTLPSRIPATELMNRPHSSMGTEQASHTYLNSGHNNVIGAKSQPNYYTSNPLSSQSAQSDGSKTSLNGGTLTGKSSSASNSYDSSTLPQMRGPRSTHHERKNSEQHLYENHEAPLAATTSRSRKSEQTSSKMAASDDLSTFCYVNLDADARKERQAFLQGYKNKSARTTPEPKLSYIQLDLKSKEAKSQSNLPVESFKMETSSSTTNINKSGGLGKEKTPLSNGETSNGKVRNAAASVAPIASTSSAVVAVDSNESPKENKETNAQDPTKASTTVPYAQIDFAKTLALSNSAANHRKL